jgi:hypothetical protein
MIPKNNWIKIYRSLLDWQWYSNTNCVRIFIHLLLKANIEKKTWQNIDVERGQIITSIEKLSQQTCLSPEQVRTVLKKLNSTHEITSKTTNKYTMITLNNYETYQNLEFIDNKQDNKQDNNPITNKQQTNNKQITTTKEYKEIKNNNIYVQNGEKIFKKPTIPEIKEYVKEKNFKVDATDFFNFYESKGWMVGKNKMKCWQSSVALWNSNHGGQNGRNNGKSKRREFKQSEMDYSQTTWDD